MRSATPEFCWPFHFCNGVIYKVELLCAVVFILFPGGPQGYLSNVKEVAFASASHLSALMRQREIGPPKAIGSLYRPTTCVDRGGCEIIFPATRRNIDGLITHRLSGSRIS
jgi:hypothetical protein